MATARWLTAGWIVTWALFAGSGAAAHAAEHELGVGLHYWETLDDLDLGDVEIDESGTSGLLLYRLNPAGPLAFEFDLEVFGDGFAGATDTAVSPQVFALIGGTLYAGVGVGVVFADELPGGDDVSDPFYVARVGLALPLLPRLKIDLNANYQADTFDDLDQADSDTITIGAHLRLRIQ